MLVAMMTAHHGFFAPNGVEYPLTMMIIALVVLIVGSGKFSIDGFFDKSR